MIASDTNRNGLQIRYASHFFNQWLGPIKEAPSNEGAFLVSETLPSGRHGGGVLRGYGYAHRASWRSKLGATGFYFGNVEVSLELWTVISGISGFDD
jgi:hypothetical protein